MKSVNRSGWAVIVLAMLVSLPGRAEPPSGYPFVAYDEGLRQAQQSGRRIFLYYGRYGCGYCGKVNAETFTDPRIHDVYTRHYVLVYLDAESGRRIRLPSGEWITEMELGARLNVFSTPVFLYLEPDGRVIFRAPGYKTVADLLAFDGYVQSGAYRRQTINQFLEAQQ